MAPTTGDRRRSAKSGRPAASPPATGGFVSAADLAKRQDEAREAADPWAEHGARQDRAQKRVRAPSEDAKAPEDKTGAEAPVEPPAPEKVPFPAALDPRIQKAIEAIGIPSLYPPQGEAIETVLEGGNVLVSIPTASGKSLIAHTSIFHSVLSRGGKALYIVPLRALASEKFEELRELAGHIPEPRLRVGIATGDLDEADTRLAQYDIIVTTSEKADSLIRHSAGWMQELSCVVADEVHLMGDSHRGPTLEVTLARLMAMDNDVRLVALSATVGNAKAIARWLKAKLVQSTWRPVQLKEGIFHGSMIRFGDGSVREVLGPPDAVTRLVLQTVADDAQCLVFVNTRRSTEAVALKLATAIKKEGLAERDQAVLEEAAKRMEEEDGEHSRLGEKLGQALRRGAAFHNAGLSSKQRRVVEDLFRARHVKVIVATPTLAAGVNLPARRVIVRDVRRFEADLGQVPLPVLEVKQMTGRAGRPRYDPYGEAVLVAKSEDEVETLWGTYLNGLPEDVGSKLGIESALRIHLLAGIATGLTPTRDAVLAFIDSTFLARDPMYGGRWQIEEKVDDVLRFLIDEGFVEAFDDGRLVGTKFGKRTSSLYIDPMSALTIREGLDHAKLVPKVEDLALLALVCSTPDVPASWLRKQDDWVEQMADEYEGRWLRPAFTDGADRETFLSSLKTALLVHDWVEEYRLDQMEAKYGFGPGDVHNRVNITEWLLYAAEEIARMEHPELQKPLKDLRRRVHAGVKKALLPLIDLEGVGRYRARRLADAGYGSIAKLKRAPLERLVKVAGFGPLLVQRVLKQLGRDVDLGTVKKAHRQVEQAEAKRERDAEKSDTEQAKDDDGASTNPRKRTAKKSSKSSKSANASKRDDKANEPTTTEDGAADDDPTDTDQGHKQPKDDPHKQTDLSKFWKGKDDA